jgi:hypothetical protein
MHERVYEVVGHIKPSGEIDAATLYWYARLKPCVLSYRRATFITQIFETWVLVNLIIAVLNLIIFTSFLKLIGVRVLNYRGLSEMYGIPLDCSL